MKQISKSLVLLFLLVVTACATAPPPPGSLAAIRQEARKAIETECVRVLFVNKRKTIYYRVAGRIVDVFGPRVLTVFDEKAEMRRECIANIRRRSGAFGYFAR